METIEKGKWSTALSVVGIALFISSYLISDDPNLGEKILIGIVFFSGIGSMIASVFLGVAAIKSKENGLLKYVGPLMILILILGILLFPLLLGLNFAP
ncbi:hypothetical protein BEP19_14750 [Ammoniphilus oxalaticus]|uniref:Uncharacterized protein n=1 Tax=Ammoniphilus oxalaticus TaxID=66863 RepID=A0A419SE85_9BACL|nr:hypothetical protein [Ammoniphilus oxalaticus]RKD21478.1 hypothetical protein BEP19_14750 [Ammoniphilus oxalaticus]